MDDATLRSWWLQETEDDEFNGLLIESMLAGNFIPKEN
jgi:hypothetical protein